MNWMAYAAFGWDVERVHLYVHGLSSRPSRMWIQAWDDYWRKHGVRV